MFQLYIYSFLATFLFTPFGIFFFKRNEKDLEYFSYQLIFGIIFISFIALLLNFFFPLDQLINSLLIVLSAYIIIKNRNVYLTKNYFFYSIISAFIIFLLIKESNVYRPDAGLYHLPFINILHHEKIVLGLSNLHFRFGHISIIQYFSAISNNILFGLNGIVFAGALISSAIIINFLFILLKKIKKNNFDLEFYFIFAIFIFIFYKLNRYSNYGNDAPAHMLYYFLVSQLLIISRNFDLNRYANTFILSTFIFMNKITLSIACLIPLIFIQKKNFLKIIQLKKIYFVTFFLSLWLIKNILISGCAIYPILNTCFDKLNWTDKFTAKYISTENEAWAKNWPDSKLNYDHKKYIKNFNWFNDWKKNYFPKLFKILFPYILFLILIYFYLYLFKKKQNIKNSSKIYFIFIPLVISLIFWFLKFPILRYGQAFIITFFALIFAIYCSKYPVIKGRINIFFLIIILGSLVFISKNMLRTYKTSNDYYNYPWPKFYSIDENNLPIDQIEIVINNKKFYKASKGICMYSVPMCSGFERKFNTKKVYSYLMLFREKN